MNSAPSLPSYNHFNILSIDQYDELPETIEAVQESEPSSPSSSRSASPSRNREKFPKWFRRLPSKIIIAATEEGPTSLRLKVELETTDTSETKSVHSLVDCGVTGELIDYDYARGCRFNLLKLPRPIPVFNIDGTPNEAGAITEAVDLILRYRNHSERTTFAVTNLGRQKLILRHSWLRKHNPEIDWVSGEVKMSRCPPRCCSGCRDEVRTERVIRRAEVQRKEACSVGSTPLIYHDSNDSEDNTSGDCLEEGDRIFATGLLPSEPSLEVRAGSTISQRLAEAFKANSKATSPVPEYLQEFSSVFSKKSFDTLPSSKNWDHAVELIPG